MKQQKGFSLIEVLVSLILVSTVALLLVEQQSQTKLLLQQIISRAESSQILDTIDENRLVSKTIKSSLNSKIKPRSYGCIKWK